MKDTNYFKDLISLYEAIGMSGEEEVVPQEEIADSGSDVNPNLNPNFNVEADSKEEIPEEENMQIENNMYNMPEQEKESSAEVMEKERLKKIFELLTELLDYSTIFYKTIDSIDINLLDTNVLKKFLIYREQFSKLLDKMNNYIIKIFNADTYEKVLYTYIVFRTETVSLIKHLRKILKLNDADSEINKENS